MSFLSGGDFGSEVGFPVQNHEDLFQEDFNFFSSENAFDDDSLMVGEFETDIPDPDSCFQSTSFSISGSSQVAPSEPSQWTSYQPPTPPPQAPFQKPFTTHSQPPSQTPPQAPPRPFPQAPSPGYQQQHLMQPNNSGAPPSGGSFQRPSFEYSSSYQPQQYQHIPQSSSVHQSMMSGGFGGGGIQLKKRKTELRPLAPQMTNFNVGGGQLSDPPPTPPPPPPKGHLTSMSTPAPFNQTPGSFLAPSLSDSETRHLTEDGAIGDLRLIAPKPPTLPPADFHCRSTQKLSSSIPASPSSRRARSRTTKRRSTSKLEREQKMRMQMEKDAFLAGSELRDQLAILSAKCAASEAESKALKERLSATETELAELRLKVKRFDSMNSPTSPGIAMSPCNSPSSVMFSPDLHCSH